MKMAASPRTRSRPTRFGGDKAKDSMMKRILVSVGLMFAALLAHPANADDPAKNVLVTPVLTTSVTSSGQAIVLPAKDPTVIVSMYEIAKGATLPEHKHPYPRYAYVLDGEIRVTNTDTGKSETYKAGDFIIEAIDQWHHAENIGSESVKLLVIDQVEHANGNVVLRK
jgi:quercetin dioxygenase-like cupin family protein